MGSDASYFKIGLFVTVAVVIGTVGVVVLGAGAIMRSTIRFETYLDESVQGLDVGAPVKFRGVRVGRVESIGFAGAKYDTVHKYVRLTLSIDHDTLVENPDEEPEETLARIQREVEAGIRVRLASSGLAGAMYLEIDYAADPSLYPSLPIDWSPENVYIPSMPSTVSRFTEGAEHVLQELRDADIRGIAMRLNATLEELSLISRKDLAPAVASLREVGEVLPGAVEDVRAALVDGLLAEANLLVGDARRVVNEDVKRAVRNLDEAVAGLSEGVDGYLAGLDRGFRDEVVPALRDIRQAAGELPVSMERLNRTLVRVDRYVQTQQHGVDEILDRIRAAAEGLTEVVELAKRYPSQVLWGAEPPRSELRRDR